MDINLLAQGCTIHEETPGLQVEIPNHTTLATPAATYLALPPVPPPKKKNPALSVSSRTHHTFQTACPVLIRKPFYHLIRLGFLGGQTQIRLRVAARNA